MEAELKGTKAKNKVQKPNQEELASDVILSDEEENEKDKDCHEAPAESEVVRHQIIQAKIRFDFALPKDVPKENGEAYARERLRHLIEKLGGLRGVEVTCLVD